MPSNTPSAPATSPCTTTRKPPGKSPIESPATSIITSPNRPLEEATVHEIAFCEIRLEHLVRAETGLLNFYRQLAFQQHSFSDPAGSVPLPTTARRRASRSEHAPRCRLARRRPGDRLHVSLRIAPPPPLRESDQTSRHPDRRPFSAGRIRAAPRPRPAHCSASRQPKGSATKR